MSAVVVDQHALGFRRAPLPENGPCGHCRRPSALLVIISPCGDPKCCTTGYCQRCVDDLGLEEVR